MLIVDNSNLQAVYNVVVIYLMGCHSTLSNDYLIFWFAILIPIFSMNYCVFSSYQLFEDCYLL